MTVLFWSWVNPNWPPLRPNVNSTLSDQSTVWYRAATAPIIGPPADFSRRGLMGRGVKRAGGGGSCPNTWWLLEPHVQTWNIKQNWFWNSISRQSNKWALSYKRKDTTLQKQSSIHSYKQTGLSKFLIFSLSCATWLINLSVKLYYLY